MAANITCNPVTNVAPPTPDFSWAAGAGGGCAGAFVPTQEVGAWVRLHADGTGEVGWWGGNAAGTWLPAGRAASEYTVTVHDNAFMCSGPGPIGPASGSDTFGVLHSLAVDRRFEVEGTMSNASTANLSLFGEVTHVASGESSFVGVSGMVAGSSIVECETC